MKKTLQKVVNALNEDLKEAIEDTITFHTEEFNYAYAQGRAVTIEEIIDDLCATFNLKNPTVKEVR